jgi:hypothetical protein
MCWNNKMEPQLRYKLAKKLQASVWSVYRTSQANAGWVFDRVRNQTKPNSQPKTEPLLDNPDPLRTPH